MILVAIQADAVLALALRIRVAPTRAASARHAHPAAFIHLGVLELPVFIGQLHEALLLRGVVLGPELVGGAPARQQRDEEHQGAQGELHARTVAFFETGSWRYSPRRSCTIRSCPM